MNLINNLLSPVSIAFIVIIIGYYFGRVRLFKVSLDLSGVLIVAVFVGYLFATTEAIKETVDISEIIENLKIYSGFGTALFVSSIGITTGDVFNIRKWKDIKSTFIGSLMAASAFLVMRSILLVDDKISASKLLGSLCGALTTTPGLSAACELENVIAEEVVLGYGSSYLFGVVATVLLVQILTRKKAIFYGNKGINKENIENKIALSGLIQISFVILLGMFIGNIELLNFSLGSSGGMLCSGIIVGFLIKKLYPTKIASTNQLKPFRNMGLVLFFVGNGIPSGMQIGANFDVKSVLYGIVLTIIPLTLGLLLFKIFYKTGSPAIVIAGGMTSTPAIAVITEKQLSISLDRYALAYFGALITTVILIRTC